MRRVSSRAALAVLLLSSLATVRVRAQTVDELVAKNLEARGGAERWSKVVSVKMTGTTTAQGRTLPLTVYARRPNHTRQEYTVKDNLRMVQGFDGTTAWVLNPMRGTDAQAMPPEVSAMVESSSDFDGSLVNYKQKGHTLDLVGKAKVDAEEVYHLKVTTKSGQVQHYYLDADNGVELKKTEDVEMGGQKQTLETRMSDYRAIDGVLMPYSIQQTVDGKPIAQITIESVELNPKLDDDLFRMPKK